jgi:hypothetical protein
MGFNGSGTYVRVHNWASDAAAGIKISSTRMDAEDDSLASALSQCMTKDGQQTPTANLKMGGFKFTGLGDGSSANDSLRVDQVQDQDFVYVDSVAGTVDAIELTPAPASAGYGTGQGWEFTASGANTGAVTVDVSGLGAKAITKYGSVALGAGDIQSGANIRISYDGTQFQLMNPYSTSVSLYTSGVIIAGDEEGSAHAYNLSAPRSLLVSTSAASGLTVLAAGTAGQVLALNASAHEYVHRVQAVATATSPTSAWDTTNANLFRKGDLVVNTSSEAVHVAVDNATASADWALLNREDLIAVVSASSTAAFDFTSGITDRYNRYRVECDYLVPSSAADMRVRVALGGTFKTDSKYRFGVFHVRAAGSTEVEGSNTGDGIPLNDVSGDAITANTSSGWSGDITLINPANTTKWKNIMLYGNYMRSSDGGFVNTHGGGCYSSSTAAVDGIRIYVDSASATFAHGEVRLWGIR